MLKKGSVEPHSREEWDGWTLIINEPLISFLKDTLTGQSVSFQDCIQAGFCGHCLMSAIPKLHPTFTNLSNLMPMEIHTGNTVRVTIDLGVIFAPITPLSDGGVHFTFDLTHGVEWGGLLTLLIYRGMSPVAQMVDTSLAGTRLTVRRLKLNWRHSSHDSLTMRLCWRSIPLTVLTLTLLTKVHNGVLRGFVKVNLNTVEGMFDDLNCHEVLSVDSFNIQRTGGFA